MADKDKKDKDSSGWWKSAQDKIGKGRKSIRGYLTDVEDKFTSDPEDTVVGPAVATGVSLFKDHVDETMGDMEEGNVLATASNFVPQGKLFKMMKKMKMPKKHLKNIPGEKMFSSAAKRAPDVTDNLGVDPKKFEEQVERMYKAGVKPGTAKWDKLVNQLKTKVKAKKQTDKDIILLAKLRKIQEKGIAEGKNIPSYSPKGALDASSLAKKALEEARKKSMKHE